MKYILFLQSREFILIEYSCSYFSVPVNIQNTVASTLDNFVVKLSVMHKNLRIGKSFKLLFNVQLCKLVFNKDVCVGLCMMNRNIRAELTRGIDTGSHK